MLRRLSHWLKNKFIRGRKLNATRLVAGSFALIILTGALLLALPAASRSGESVGLFDSFFTATSATCVTGLVTVDTDLTWSPFGQAVILVLIQLGGLGFMTVVSIASLMLHRRIGLSERLLMVSTLNLNNLNGVVRVVRRALVGTAVLEGAGTLLLAVRMVPRYGLAQGLWHAVFHAVSAFCNAGFDLQGGDSGAFSSLAAFQDDGLVLLVTAGLVIAGGLGFFVWDDILTNRRWKKLSLYTKIALGITGLLVLGGTLFFFAAERGNGATLGSMTTGEKWLNAFFQSVTLRTAGFNVIDQGAMTDNSLVMSCLLMLVGGCSGSTAGGLKTVTVWVLFMLLFTGLRGREEIVFRGRTLPIQRAMNAVTLFFMVALLMLAGTMALSFIDGVNYLSAVFETASALGTVGLTTGLTPQLSQLSQGVLIFLMYTGRVGVLTCSLAFLNRSGDGPDIQYPKFDVMIG